MTTAAGTLLLLSHLLRHPLRKWPLLSIPRHYYLTRLRDSRESSGFHDDPRESFDPSGSSSDVLPPHPMTAPVSPNVPLSASSSHSDGWKYSSQKLLWKLKPKYINFSHASSTSSSTDSAWKSLAISITRLQKLLPGVSVVKQKDPLSALRQKRLKLVKSAKTGEKAYSSDGQRRPSGSTQDTRVFGVSLIDCMENEKRLEEAIRCRSLDDATVGSSGSTLTAGSQPDSSQSQNRSLAKQKAKPVRSETELIKYEDRRWLYPSTQNMCVSNPSSPSPLSASLPTKDLSTSVTFLLATEPEKEQITGRFVKKARAPSSSLSWSLDCPPDEFTDMHMLQVPRIVDNCIKYLIEHGLHQLGLFRIAGNATRCRQLRNALEKAGGEMIYLADDVTAVNDIAAILKEYFRDLPQPLLPKEHYQAYIAAAKLTSDDRVECVRHLLALLNPPNIDTLFVLMKFLHQIPGNKMDARNLATIFAPCILRADHDKLHATLAENEQQICIIETIILEVETIFTIPKDLQCKIYNKLRETEPDRLDRILNNLSRLEGNEPILCSPFPATVEEDSPRDTQKTTGNSTEDIQNESKEFDSISQKTRKKKIVTQRSGSWPFSLAKPSSSREELRFFNEPVKEARVGGDGSRGKDTHSLAPCGVTNLTRPSGLSYEDSQQKLAITPKL
ncbi:hypothetical protein WR25_01440 [Diploscapter pachys]|uniref:Rho-GAP domain-containing protein n=1 Tax=Diploscapter pachys TaxID=2018661 RepID=A0A2A2JNU0_9BILA|nr:hypothetical protein WR25_01440 [Diploscapter pachys]